MKNDTITDAEWITPVWTR